MSKFEQSLLARAAGVVAAPAIIRARTRDNMLTFDSRTIDSTGSFLIGELERLDQTLHMPLASVTWSRDIDLREDVSIADETSSFTNSSFAAAGGASPNGKSWIGKDANAIAGIALDIGKTANPLTLWGMQIGWTIPELESAQKLGRPVDQQKFAGMQLKHNMDVDEQVYIGDSVLGVTGLVNNAAVTNLSNALTGNWSTATPDQILADVNELLTSVWAASGYSYCPAELRLPPAKFGLLVSMKVSSAGNISVLEYLKQNTISNSINGRPLAMREGMGQFSNEYKEMLAKAGMDSQEAAKSSHEFMNEVRSLGAAFVILGQKVAATLTGKLAGDLRRFRDGVVDNFGRVAGIVEKVARGVLVVADVVSTLALRGMQAIGAVVDWFNGLDGTVKTIIETVAALGIAWKLLSAGFLATPVGRIVALGTAILALYDDYKVWKEGGKTLIDWSQWEPGIKAAGAGIRWLKDLLSDMMYRAIAAVDAINAIWHRDWKRLKFAVGEFLAGQGKPYGQPEAPAAAEAGTPQGAPAAPAAPAARTPQAPAASGAGARQPRGIRNNNPGNLNYVGQPGATRESGPNGRFAVFQTAEEGLVALARQLRLYAQRGINSVRAIISKFAPPTENDTQAYIESVSKRLGVDANATLNVNDPRVMQGLMDAIIKVENGRNPYSTEQLASASAVRAAGAQAAAQAPVTLTQETTIHVTGGGDPQSTAQAVSQAQNGVNQRLVRNMRTAVQ